MIRQRRGFTLVELLLVITLISLTVGLVGPVFFETVGRWQVMTEAKRMSGWFRHAQQLAITTQRNMRFHFIQTHYSLEAVSGTGEAENVATVTLDHSVTLHGDGPYLTFDPLGAPDRAAVMGFARRAVGEIEAEVRVAPVTGQVRITKR